MPIPVASPTKPPAHPHRLRQTQHVAYLPHRHSLRWHRSPPGCQGDRSADSTVDGSALYAAITCCPQSPDCCPPCRGIGVRVAPDSAPRIAASRWNQVRSVESPTISSPASSAASAKFRPLDHRASSPGHVSPFCPRPSWRRSPGSALGDLCPSHNFFLSKPALDAAVLAGTVTNVQVCPGCEARLSRSRMLTSMSCSAPVNLSAGAGRPFGRCQWVVQVRGRICSTDMSARSRCRNVVFRPRSEFEIPENIGEALLPMDNLVALAWSGWPA